MPLADDDITNDDLVDDEDFDEDLADEEEPQPGRVRACPSALKSLPWFPERGGSGMDLILELASIVLAVAALVIRYVIPFLQQ